MNVFHYTTGNLLKRIIKQGSLVPDRSNPENSNEVPSVTFSSNPIWERTRYRIGKLPDGRVVMMGQALLQEFDGGLYRIVVPQTVAPLTWHEMKETLHLDHQTVQGIYDFAVSVGARPSEWYATTSEVPADLWESIEKRNVEGVWEKIEVSEESEELQSNSSQIVEIKLPTVPVEGI